jgi:hypothetical protein
VTSRSRAGVVALVSAVFMLVGFVGFSGAQVLSQPPLLSDPSNDCGCSRVNDGIPVSSGMLSPFPPKIPNLDLGFLYYFGRNVSTGRFTADYTLPFRLSADSALFGEAHAEGWDSWKRPSVSIATPAGFTTTTSTANNRIDLSFGGGYCTMILGRNALLGVNGFYDTSRLSNKWYLSGGVRLEMAANVGEDDALDLTLMGFVRLICFSRKGIAVSISGRWAKNWHDAVSAFSPGVS